MTATPTTTRRGWANEFLGIQPKSQADGGGQSVLDRPDPEWVQRGREKAAISQKARGPLGGLGTAQESPARAGTVDVPRNNHGGPIDRVIDPATRHVLLSCNHCCTTCLKWTRNNGACPGLEFSGLVAMTDADLPMCHSIHDCTGCDCSRCELSVSCGNAQAATINEQSAVGSAA